MQRLPIRRGSLSILLISVLPSSVMRNTTAVRAALYLPAESSAGAISASIRPVAFRTLTCWTSSDLKAEDNDELHITSDRFDEPLGVALVESSEFVVAVDGAKGDMPVTYPGGRGGSLVNPMRACPQKAGFDVQDHPTSRGRCRRTFVIEVNPMQGAVGTHDGPSPDVLREHDQGGASTTYSGLP
ncbi:poly-gamma-glutamate hydrolase family protein [Variovorax sp. V213]|uniref:poly-gamma-glutamate hydrolase family protein n=1 Tax=Variovorax sp. V213 TaxID=3065955 RepID=UPI0034E87205